jgi:hypothetical protein
MNEPERDLVDEAVLRRALRFELDEIPPRFDAVAIAALAHDARSGRQVAAGSLVLMVAVGLSTAAVWSALIESAPAMAGAAADAALRAVIAVATLVVPVAQTAGEPAVPLSLLAALAVAVIHELRERGGTVHVRAS